MRLLDDTAGCPPDPRRVAGTPRERL